MQYTIRNRSLIRGEQDKIIHLLMCEVLFRVGNITLFTVERSDTQYRLIDSCPSKYICSKINHRKVNVAEKKVYTTHYFLSAKC